MKISKFRQDLNMAEQGTTVDIGDGASVTVARIGNKNYISRLKELTKPYKRQILNRRTSRTKCGNVF
jgi:hypothetical protein